MTIQRIFPNTTPITDFQVFRRRAINLYREWLREIPRAVIKFPLDISVAEGRARVRLEFDRYAALFAHLPASDPSTLSAMNSAIFKGTQELIEVHNRWSQKTHFMRWFEGAWEPQNPQLAASESDRQVRRVNSGISGKGNSAFLDDFLTK